jgi:hypothetical protein
MRITVDGNVGIGASNPSYKLHVYGSSPELVVHDSGANGTRVYIKPTNTSVFIGATYASNAVPINFTLNGGSTTSMLIDANSNVGIGVTPTTIVGATGVNGKGLQGESWTISSLQGTDESYFGNNLYSSAYNVWSNRVNAASGAYYITGGTHIFLRGAAQAAGTITPTESMRITATGNVLVGRTSGGLDNTSGVTISQSSIGMQTEGNAAQIIMNRTTSDGTIVEIRRNNIAVGTISVTTTATAYNTTSDYRLKESIKPLNSGLTRVNALKPSVYNWKSDGSNGEGFLAHELAEVVPLAVTGQKDAVNDDGSINPQSVDLSKVVPILVAAIQELTARIKILESR